MESATIMMEGGDWISVNEEAAFMAKFFSSSSSANSELEMSSLSLSSSCYSGHESNISMPGVDANSFYSTNTDSNLYSLSQGSSYSSSSENAAYQSHENYYLIDPQQFLAVDGSSLPIDFNISDTKTFIQVLQGNQMEINHNLNLEMSCDNLDESGAVLAQSEHFQLKTENGVPEIEPSGEGIISGSSECGRKRSRIPEAQKGKRSVRSKSSHRLDSDENTNAPVLDRQNSCVVSSEGESNRPQESSGGCSDETAAANQSFKTRASRGAATDPQSLYARKRRERINERLRTLQKLVPNGTKVDISTMLEEAVNYVQFMQLQIKLLSSDDLWMYAPLAYNGMDMGLASKINTFL